MRGRSLGRSAMAPAAACCSEYLSITFFEHGDQTDAYMAQMADMASPLLSCLSFTLSVSLSRLLDSFRRAVLQSWPASFLLNPAGSQAPSYYYHITGGIRSDRLPKTKHENSGPVIRSHHHLTFLLPLSTSFTVPETRLLGRLALQTCRPGLVWSGLAEHRNSGSGSGSGTWGVHPSDAGGQQPFYYVQTSLFPKPYRFDR
ncbi:hypothetical protein CMUS01_00252 [Colletotrichum musicola]|uniref:Uncharacterized protein n=1 Tax=Colletotrichum musicola TaxID=2175873 RepID=A0A8H6NZ43_9PEZI|nr:hypothetical protein CMUS01_00252 [Colletotrichum musicola]